MNNFTATVSAEAMRHANLGIDDTVRLHSLDGSIVMCKRDMTAYDLVMLIHELREYADELMEELTDVCGYCTDCGGLCPSDYNSDEALALPHSILDAAGIDHAARLLAEVNSEHHSVILFPAEEEHTLDDIPEQTKDLLEDEGICMGTLGRLLHSGEVVYEA